MEKGERDGEELELAGVPDKSESWDWAGLLAWQSYERGSSKRHRVVGRYRTGGTITVISVKVSIA